jgi:hypothetical protein
VAELSPFDRLRAWVVTGAPGRAYAFVVNFSVGAWTLWRARRGRRSGTESR